MNRFLILALACLATGITSNTASAQQPGTWGNHWRVGPESYQYGYNATGSWYTRTTPTVQTWGHDIWGRTYNNVSPGFTYGHVNGQTFGGYTPYYGGPAYGYSAPPGGWGPPTGFSGYSGYGAPVGGYGAPAIGGGGGPRMVCIPAY